MTPLTHDSAADFERLSPGENTSKSPSQNLNHSPEIDSRNHFSEAIQRLAVEICMDSAVEPVEYLMRSNTFQDGE